MHVIQCQCIVIIMSFKQSNETNHVNTISFSTLDHDLLWDLATQVIASSIMYIQGS